MIKFFVRLVNFKQKWMPLKLDIFPKTHKVGYPNYDLHYSLAIDQKIKKWKQEK